MTNIIETDALVVGGGPAGLMAAQVLAEGGAKTLLCEAMPTVGRKFLMAGKSGLNVTMDEPNEVFGQQFFEASDQLGPMLAAMGPRDVVQFCQGLGQPVFTGSSRRVFPKAMKASPLLRAWLARLETSGVEIQTRWKLTDINDQTATFTTQNGEQAVRFKALILALGGASWSRLGADGAWTSLLNAHGIETAAFAPANMGFSVDWSDAMTPHFGAAVKPVTLSVGDMRHRGEFVISKRGLEGSGIYAVSRAMRLGAPLSVDLLPDTGLAEATARLVRPRGKLSLSNFLRKTVRLEGPKRALLMEFGRPLPHDAAALAGLIKALPMTHEGPRPMDEAISVAGGVAWSALNDDLMLEAMPGVFCTGEMLDWEAPTGGYLITACLATGKWAGKGALRWILDQTMPISQSTDEHLAEPL
ncbi:MAG: TIGR03862 family flavoprotein [Pseudomonadota bacterium]